MTAVEAQPVSSIEELAPAIHAHLEEMDRIVVYRPRSHKRWPKLGGSSGDSKAIRRDERHAASLVRIIEHLSAIDGSVG